ncbi:hypothetical protein B0H11DRAFT_2238388 [Mycena galericulata]|nr:hypothetical protein B0H11DRAFT_2238388 [Mycena galericulata]
MGKNKSQKTVSQEKELHALSTPFPDNLDRYFQHPSDKTDDFATAYARAAAFTAELGDTRAAYLWQQALEIGFRAGRSDADIARQGDMSNDFSLGRETGLQEGRTAGLREGKRAGRDLGNSEGLKEGEAIGFEKGVAEGLKEGLGEGKRLGFVAGRDFGEKQAAKMSKNSTPARVFVDVGVGTDSPAADLSPPTPSSTSPTISTSTPADALHAADIPHAPSTTFKWADEASEPLLPDTRNPTHPMHLPPRNFSALRSDSTSLTPFGTLQYRTYRTYKTSRAPRHSASHAPLPYRSSAASIPFCHPSARSFASKPFRVAFCSTLDWDHDPRLSDLSRVLRAMGWAREGGEGGRDEDVA